MGETKTKKKTKMDPETPVFRDAGFVKHYATRALTQMTEYDFRVMFTNEKVVDNMENSFYLADSMIILTPIAARELMKDLRKSINEWEETHGPIPERPKITQVTRLAMEE